MKSSTRKFFRNGVDAQKRADIIIELKRPDREKIKNWTVEQKLFLKAFIHETKESFKDFISELQKISK